MSAIRSIAWRRAWCSTAVVARVTHQSRLKQSGRGERADQRQRQQLAHTRYARLVRYPQTTEGGGGQERAVENGAGQDGFKKVALAAPPRRDVIDFESNANPEQDRQGNDVGVVELEVGK